jgi:hypothetical protein
MNFREIISLFSIVIFNLGGTMKYTRALALLLVCALSISLTSEAWAQKDRRGALTIENNTSWSFLLCVYK